MIEVLLLSIPLLFTFWYQTKLFLFYNFLYDLCLSPPFFVCRSGHLNIFHPFYQSKSPQFPSTATIKPFFNHHSTGKVSAWQHKFGQLTNLLLNINKFSWVPEMDVMVILVLYILQHCWGKDTLPLKCKPCTQTACLIILDIIFLEQPYTIWFCYAITM